MPAREGRQYSIRSLVRGIHLPTGESHLLRVDLPFVLEGVILHHHGRYMANFPFRLRRGGEDGEVVTPDNLSGTTRNRFENDWWWSDEEGRYRYVGVPRDEYFLIFRDRAEWRGNVDRDEEEDDEHAKAPEDDGDDLIEEEDDGEPDPDWMGMEDVDEESLTPEEWFLDGEVE